MKSPLTFFVIAFLFSACSVLPAHILLAVSGKISNPPQGLIGIQTILEVATIAQSDRIPVNADGSFDLNLDFKVDDYWFKQRQLPRTYETLRCSKDIQLSVAPPDAVLFRPYFLIYPGPVLGLGDPAHLIRATGNRKNGTYRAVVYLYADRDVAISGTCKPNLGDSSIETGVAINITLKQGWNLIQTRQTAYSTVEDKFLYENFSGNPAKQGFEWTYSPEYIYYSAPPTPRQ